MTIDLRLGRWQDALADIEMVDAVITDPPYSERTHGAYREMAEVGRNSIAYAAWSAEDVDAFVLSWASRCRGWFCVLTDHVLAPAIESAMSRSGRYTFAPIACMEPGSRVRLSGDGPSQWSVWLVVSRPKTREAQKWGALPGGYVVEPGHGWRSKGAQARSGITGGKPLWLMQQIVSDYSRPGQLIADPCAGMATTLLAAAIEGRRAIGSEMDPETFAKAQARIARGYTPTLPICERVEMKQEPLL